MNADVRALAIEGGLIILFCGIILVAFVLAVGL